MSGYGYGGSSSGYNSQAPYGQAVDGAGAPTDPYNTPAPSYGQYHGGGDGGVYQQSYGQADPSAYVQQHNPYSQHQAHQLPPHQLGFHDQNQQQQPYGHSQQQPVYGHDQSYGGQQQSYYGASAPQGSYHQLGQAYPPSQYSQADAYTMQQPYLPTTPGQNHSQQYDANGNPINDKGLGATLIGGAAGGFAGNKLGGGMLGSVLGAVAGAIGANALEGKSKKKKKEKKYGQGQYGAYGSGGGHGHHKKRGGGDSSSSSDSSDSDDSRRKHKY